MTIVYDRVDINGNTITDYYTNSVDKSVGDFNTLTSFNFSLDNQTGKHSSDLNINNPVIIYAGQAPLNGLILHGRFEDGSGTIIKDEIYENDGTATSNIIFDTGKIGSYSINFPNNNSQITFSGNSTIMNPSGITVAFWMKTGSVSQDICRKWESVNNQRSWSFDQSTANGSFLVFRVSINGSSSTNSAASTTHIDTNSWMHAAGTYNGSLVSVYVNGSLEQSATAVGSLFSSTSNIKLGNNFITGSDFSGNIDDFRIYNYPLPLSQIQELYNNGSGVDSCRIVDGVIEDIDYKGSPNKEIVEIRGRGIGVILQDIIVQPRIFKNTEISEIVLQLMTQNVSSSLITTNNVKTTTTTIDRITFVNISVFDALQRLAERADYYFYVDEFADLHFEPKSAISSNLTFDNNNITTARFRKADQDMFNLVNVYGNTIRTNEEQIFTVGTDNTGSIYNLNFKPHNTQVLLSGTANTQIQPGGVINFDDPATDDVKFLVDFDSRLVILTSGTTAGNNIIPTGSKVIIRYDKDTQILRRRSDPDNRSLYGPKDKTIINENINTPEEATAVAAAFLNEHSEPHLQGTLDINGVVNIIPGQTCVANIPYEGINNQTYTILNARYDFDTSNNRSQNVLSVDVNTKLSDITDIIADQLRRLRQVEANSIQGNIMDLEAAIGSIGVSGATIAYSRSIGSGFFFHVPLHNILDSPKSLLGDVRAGSTLITLT